MPLQRIAWSPMLPMLNTASGTIGDGRVEVTDGGKIDRMVTFDKPGTFPLQLVAHNGKHAAKQAGAVKIENPPAGSVTAILKVIDSGSRVERNVHNVSATIPVPGGKNPPQTFSKALQAQPGFTIAEAVLVKSTIASVKNLKLAVVPDKRSVVVSGEWVGNPRAAGGSDVIVPIKLTEERTTAQPPATTMVTGTIGGNGGLAGAISHFPQP